MTTDRPADDVLRGVSALIKLLGAATAGAVPLLMPDRLVPVQLEATRAAGSLLAALGFLLAWAWQDRLAGSRRALVATACSAAFVVIALNQAFVVSWEVGEPPDTTTVSALTGFAYTDAGEALLDGIGDRDAPRAEQLAALGAAQARRLWGWTLTAVAVPYTLGLWVLLIAGSAALVAASGSGAPPLPPVRKPAPDDVARPHVPA